MSILGQFAGITATFLLTFGGTQAAHAEPLRISYFIQVGSGPFFVAQDKGFFAKEGVDVALVNIEDHAAIFAAMDAGQIGDANPPATIIPWAPRHCAAGS